MTDDRDVLDLRPRIRQDVLFTQTRSGVLFHNSDGGFQLSGASAYRVAALVVPHLDGRLSVGELCAGLPRDRAAMITDLVRALESHGFVRPYPAGEPGRLQPEVLGEIFAEQLAYLDHYADRAHERFAAFREARVAVLGDDATAAYCALGLVRNGCAAVSTTASQASAPDAWAELRSEVARLVELGAETRVDRLATAEPVVSWADLAGFDFVVCVGPQAPSQAFSLVTAGVPQGTRVLPVVVADGRAILGPSAAPDEGSCWLCMVLRHEANSADPATLWRRMSMGDEAGLEHRLGRTAAALLGNLAAYEIFRIATGALPAETIRQAVLHDLESFDTSVEAVARHPRCTVCSDGKTAEVEPADGEEPLLSVPTGSTATDVDEPEPAMKALADKSALVSPVLGVFAGFEDDAITQVPLKAAGLRLGLPGGERRLLTAFDLHHAAGARVRAVQLAAQVYAEREVAAHASVSRSEASTSAWAMVDPGRLSTAARNDLGPDDVAAWTPVRSLSAKAVVLVPKAAVWPFTSMNADGGFRCSSAGSGVGDDLAQARFVGLMSALTLTDVDAAIAGSGPALDVAPALYESDAGLRFMAAAVGHLGARLELIDISAAADAGVFTLFAKVHDPQASAPHWAVATDVDWHRAASSAVRDALGRFQLAHDEAVAQDIDSGDPLVPALDPATVSGRGTLDVVPDARCTPASVLDVLAARGRDVLCADLTTPDLAARGVHVVRVLLAERDA